MTHGCGNWKWATKQTSLPISYNITQLNSYKNLGSQLMLTMDTPPWHLVTKISARENKKNYCTYGKNFKHKPEK